jgi:hypothetical protein
LNTDEHEIRLVWAAYEEINCHLETGNLDLSPSHEAQYLMSVTSGTALESCLVTKVISSPLTMSLVAELAIISPFVDGKLQFGIHEWLKRE